ncbi:MAG: hypothetical protein II801_00905, partial [Bacteroidaceae bacterium]|nr:hypothetical protein [Bacteroidaceae bacterium]
IVCGRNLFQLRTKFTSSAERIVSDPCVASRHLPFPEEEFKASHTRDGSAKAKNFVFCFAFRSLNLHFGCAEVTPAREHKPKKLRLLFCVPLT